MKLVRIITNIETGEGLCAVRYRPGQPDEFERLFELWIRNTEYLFRFFLDNRKSLQSGFYRGTSIEQAVRSTRYEAKYLQKTLLPLAQGGIQGNYCSLQELFRPLGNNEYRLCSLQKSKARGNSEKRWLRIYAIRFAENCFVVTGGAIKLTFDMAAPHLNDELKKLEMTRLFLIDNDLRDQSDLEYLEI